MGVGGGMAWRFGRVAGVGVRLAGVVVVIWGIGILKGEPDGGEWFSGGGRVAPVGSVRSSIDRGCRWRGIVGHEVERWIWVLIG